MNILNIFYYWPYTFLPAIIILIIFIVFIKKNYHFYNYIITFFIFILLHWLFIGYVMVPGKDDDDYYPQFFIKTHPTFQIKFRDFYLDAGDIPLLSNMSIQYETTIGNYCFYRYNFIVKNKNDIQNCINYIHPEVNLEKPNG